MYASYRSSTFRNTVLGVLLALLQSPLSAGQQPQNMPAPLTISQVVVNTVDSNLVIKGHRFSAASPTVLLADQALQIQDYSATEIVAELPKIIQPGTYRLKVIDPGRIDARGRDDIDVAF